MKKTIFAAALMLFALLFAFALCEEENYIPTAEGGVIYRETATYRTRALIEELDVAYLDMDTPYMTKGVQTKFTVHASGGDGRYTYTFTIWWREKQEQGYLSYIASSGETRSNSWLYTPTRDKGQYMLTIRIKDSAGSVIEWQSKVFESSTHACVLKARSLAEECKRNATSDYARALWFHDWLIMNANYDYTYTYYYPDGVLLHGTGVCQSYALAYEMLLKLVGIECLYVTGTAGGGAHGWNLVKIDGEWYHVDCTWDDPGTGGEEHHGYFCVPDAVMEKDHAWKHEAQIMPESTGKDYMYVMRSGADTCQTQEDVIRILNKAVENKTVYSEIWYAADEGSLDFRAAFNAWHAQAKFPKDFVTCRYWVDDESLKVDFDYGNGWPDKSIPVSMVIDPSDVDMEISESMRLLVLSVPSAADKTNLTWVSSDPSVVSVDGGLVKAVNPGVCVVSASHPGGAKAEIVLYVHSHNFLSVPSFVKTIEEEAFSGCEILESVVIDEGVCEIGDYAFKDCELLMTVSIPDSVTNIGNGAFDGCERVVIECSEGSHAHLYAVSEGISYSLVSNVP